MSNINLTAEDLKAIVATAVAAAVQEARKPDPPSKEEIANQQMAQQHREANAASVIAEIQGRKALQMICAHEHSKREGGGTHCSWVRDEDPRSPGYVLCQKCQGQIRPGEYDPNGLPFQRCGRAIYDTNLFNKLFQDCGEAVLIGG
jgi:hypothetical protein